THRGGAGSGSAPPRRAGRAGRSAIVPPVSTKRRWRGRVALVLASTLGALLIVELSLVLLGVAPARYRTPRALESADKRWALDLYPDDPRGALPLDLRDPATLATWSARVPAVRAHATELPHAVASRFTDGLLCR